MRKWKMTVIVMGTVASEIETAISAFNRTGGKIVEADYRLTYFVGGTKVQIPMTTPAAICRDLLAALDYAGLLDRD